MLFEAGFVLVSWNMLGEVLLGPTVCCDFFGTFMRV